MKVIILALLFISCSNKNTSMPLRIGTNIWPGYEPLYLAKENNDLEKNVLLAEMSSATEVIRAFRNNQIEIAALTMDEVIRLASEGMDPVIIHVLDESKGADVLIGQKRIKSLSELQGKTIGVEESALGGYFLSRVLEKSSLDMNKLKVKFMEFDKHENEFLSNKVDAIITFDPIRSKLLTKGGNLLFSSKDIPGEILDVLVTKKSTLMNRKAEIIKISKAWNITLEKINQRPKVSFQIMAERENVSIKDFEASWGLLSTFNYKKNNEFLCGKNNEFYSNVNKLKNFMLKASLLKKDINIADLINKDLCETR